MAVDQTGQDRSGNASIAGNPQGSGANGKFENIDSQSILALARTNLVIINLFNSIGQHSVVTIRIKKEIPEGKFNSSM